MANGRSSAARTADRRETRPPRAGAREPKAQRRPPQRAQPDFATRWPWLVPACLVMVTVLAFLPALQNGFVSWDDQKNFIDNPHYRGLGWTQLSWMWSTFHMGHYVPLSWMTLGADYLLWGMNPAGYHATSIAFHAANAVLLYFLARRLFVLAVRETADGGAPPEQFAIPAAFAALLFAVHPLRVESVAWVTERRDTLSLLFYLLTVLAYLRADTAPKIRSRWYSLALAAFACGLLSKATVMTAPALLALLNVYPLRRIGPKNWWGPAAREVALELAPFALLSAGFIALSIVALHPPDQLSLAAKLAVSAYSLNLYLLKTVLPIGLSPLYEMPRHVDPLDARFLAPYLSCIVLAIATWAMRRRFPGGATTLAALVIITLPMLGIVQNGPQIAADRYTYHGAPALAMLASGALLLVLPASVVLRRTAGAIVLALFGVVTWNQTQAWRDSESLWTRVLTEDPNAAIGHSGMATVRYGQGKIGEGLEHSRRAVELAPEYPEAHNDLGVGLAHEGQLGEAADHYRQAIAIQPTYDEAHNNLGVVLARQGDIDGAIDQYRRALELNPDYADAHVNWGNALVRAGHPADAIPHYQEALSIRLNHADAHHNWGVALAQQGRFAEAASQFRAALADDPNHAEARLYLTRAEQRMLNGR